MKKTFRMAAVVLSLIMVLSALPFVVMAEDNDHRYDRFEQVGQQTHHVKPTYTPIVLDGKISEGEWNAEAIEIRITDPGVAWLDWSVNFPQDELSEIIPFHIKYYVTYNQYGLYVGAEITEPAHYCPDGSQQNLWTHDCLEVDVSLDPYGYIEEGEFTEADMLDRIRNSYALVEEPGQEPYSVGYCYTASSYGAFAVSTTPMDSDYYCMGREEQVTTYELYFPWEDLYFEEAAPAEVYINFQLHIADDRYTEYCNDGYNSCLGGIRYAAMLTDDQKTEYDALTGMIMHIYKLDDYQTVNNGGVPIETESEGDTPEEATNATPEDTTAAETAATVTEAPTQAATVAPTTEAATAGVTEAPAATTADTEDKGGCASTIGAASAIVFLAAAACVALRKKH